MADGLVFEQDKTSVWKPWYKSGDHGIDAATDPLRPLNFWRRWAEVDGQGYWEVLVQIDPIEAFAYV